MNKEAQSTALLAAIPFILVAAVSFVLPVAGMAATSVLVTDQGSTRLGLDNFAAAFSGANGTAVINSLFVCALSASIGAIMGAVIAFCITRLRSRAIDTLVPVISSVLANSGGVTLAFSFIVMFGNVGVLTGLFGLSNTGFTLYGWPGLVLMYQYFLIPTMVLVTLPAFAGIRDEWRQASAALGGSTLRFWLRIGLPVVMPSLLGGWVLLFGAAFATHASAAVLLGTGSYPLVPLTIAGNLSGGISSGREGVAMALGLLMTVIAAVSLLVSSILQRRSATWLS